MVTIYHNPDSVTSRNVLSLLRHAGLAPKIVEYLKTPPSREELTVILGKAKLSPADVLRKNCVLYAELGLEKASDATRLDAMAAHPRLINRPFVVTDTAAALCRPSDVALDLLPAEPSPDALKEDGVPFLRDVRVAATDPALKAALEEVHLPASDLGEPGRAFFAYRSLSGRYLGFGGYERYGQDVLLRSIVVLARGEKVGRNLAPLLMYRAFREGGRTAWLFSSSTADFFGKLGFVRREHAEAPAAILTAQQAKALRPQSAVLMSKAIDF